MNRPKFEVGEIVFKKGTIKTLMIVKIHESKRKNTWFYDVVNSDGSFHPFWYYEKDLEPFGARRK